MPEEHCATGLNKLDMDRDKLPRERALCLQWYVEEDTFKFQMAVQQKPCTRLGMFSISSSVYDAIGFLSPVLMPAKIILQELCRRNFGWYDAFPQDLLHQWTMWLDELKNATQIPDQ